MNRGSSKKTPNSARPSPKRSRRQTRLPPGTVIVRYKELLTSVPAGTSQYLFVPGSSGLPHLDARGRMYEMYRLRGPVRVQYRAAVGTTTNGEVLMGVDYDAKDCVLSYNGTAALSPKAMSPVWRDSTLNIPHARAMKQKWLVTATDISVTSGVPTNFREDSVAFALIVTNTGNASPGSIWVEYNVEFASPRVPEPVVNTSVVTNTSSAGLTNHSGYTSPVAAGGSFYLASSGGTPSFNEGYKTLETGQTGGVNWTLVNRATEAVSDTWGSLTGLTTTIVSVLASENLHALIRAYKAISLQ